MDEAREESATLRSDRTWAAIATVARVGLTVAGGLAAGLFSGAYLFGDALAQHSFPRLAVELGLGHALAGLALGALAGRLWPVALVGCWGSALVAALYLMDGPSAIGLLSAAMPVLFTAGAWAGGRLTARPAQPPPGRPA